MARRPSKMAGRAHRSSTIASNSQVMLPSGVTALLPTHFVQVNRVGVVGEEEGEGEGVCSQGQPRLTQPVAPVLPRVVPAVNQTVSLPIGTHDDCAVTVL